MARGGETEEIVRLARACLSSSSRGRDLFFAPDVPAKRERNARKIHAAHLPATEPIVVLYDATMLGNAEEGFALTADRIAWKNLLQHPRHVELRDLDPATILPLRDGTGLAGGVISTFGISSGGLADLLTTLVERAARRAAERGPYRGIADGSDGLTRLVSLARAHLGEVPAVFYHPAIPEPKLANARAVHAGRLDEGETIAALYDDTLLGGARDGFVITPARVAWKNFGGAPGSIEWSAIEADQLAAVGRTVRIMGWEIHAGEGAAFARRVASLIAALAGGAATSGAPW